MIESVVTGAGERSLDSVPAAGSGLLFGKTMGGEYYRYKPTGRRRKKRLAVKN